jgi:hypothetical protein
MLLGGILIGYVFIPAIPSYKNLVPEHPQWSHNSNAYGKPMGHIPDPSDGNVSTIQHISTSIGSNIDTKSSAKFPNTETINASVQGKTSSEYVPESLPVQPDEVRGKLRYHKELEPLESNHGHDVDGYELTQLDAAYLSGSHDTGAGSIEDYSIFERDQINDINELERQQKQKIHSNEVVLEQRNFFSSQSIPTATTPFIMTTSKLPEIQRQKIMVTGGAGFVGSHLVDKLMKEGHEVIVVDNFFTGQKKNVEHWLQHPNFR